MHPKWRHTFWNRKELNGSWQLKYTEELFANRLRGLALSFFHLTWTENDWRGDILSYSKSVCFYERIFTRTSVTHRGNVARKPFWAEGAVGDGSSSNQRSSNALALRQSSQEVTPKISSREGGSPTHQRQKWPCSRRCILTKTNSNMVRGETFRSLLKLSSNCHRDW